MIMERHQLLEKLREDLEYYLRKHEGDETIITTTIGFLLLLDKDIQKIQVTNNHG